MGHTTGNLLVIDGEEFGFAIARIVNDGLLDTTKTGAGIRGNVINIQTLYDVDHEIRRRILDEVTVNLFSGITIEFLRLLLLGRHRRSRSPSGHTAIFLRLDLRGRLTE